MQLCVVYNEGTIPKNPSLKKGIPNLETHEANTFSKAKNKQGQYPPAPARLLNVLSFQVQLTRQSLPLATADSPEAWVSN